MKIENLKTTSVYETYWKFAVKRQEIFYNRINDQEFPWTNDKILQKYKFTNVYRASDRVSQYLIKNVIYNGIKYTEEDMCFRILFFKLFNKIETWEYMESKLGDILYCTYEFEKYNKFLNECIEFNGTIYSAAYIMPSGKSSFGYEKKHQNNLKLLETMMKTEITNKVLKCKSLKALYEILMSYPTLGKFLAFQLAIDINYSELCDFDESSFVVAGPGAQNGILKCFGELGGCSYEDIIKYVANNQENEFLKRGLKFKNLYGRKLQLIDCQNLFCEVDKYSRVAHPNIIGKTSRTRIKQEYKKRELEKIEYFFPPKWNLNNK